MKIRANIVANHYSYTMSSRWVRNWLHTGIYHLHNFRDRSKIKDRSLFEWLKRVSNTNAKRGRKKRAANMNIPVVHVDPLKDSVHTQALFKHIPPLLHVLTQFSMKFVNSKKMEGMSKKHTDLCSNGELYIVTSKWNPYINSLWSAKRAGNRLRSNLSVSVKEYLWSCLIDRYITVIRRGTGATRGKSHIIYITASNRYRDVCCGRNLFYIVTTSSKLVDITYGNCELDRGITTGSECRNGLVVRQLRRTAANLN